MKLYTVLITFADFTVGIEQYEANSPKEAVELFFAKAECLQDYNREDLLKSIKKRLNSNNALIQVANNIRGVWLLNVGTEFQDFSEDLQAIYGGEVLQTDQYAPKRS